MRDLDVNSNFLSLSHDISLFAPSLISGRESTSHRFLLIYISKRWKLVKWSEKSAEAHDIWSCFARAQTFPENIWLTVTVAYTFLRAAWRSIPCIKHPMDPKKLISWVMLIEKNIVSFNLQRLIKCYWLVGYIKCATLTNDK